MANAMYNKGRQAILNGTVDLLTDNLKVILIDVADYTVNLSTDDNLDDVPAAARVATSGNLAGKSVADGVFDATDVTFTAVTGDQSEALVIYRDSGLESTSSLIAYIDTASAGLPVTPNGGNITVTWSNGANKIFNWS